LAYLKNNNDILKTSRLHMIRYDTKSIMKTMNGEMSTRLVKNMLRYDFNYPVLTHETVKYTSCIYHASVHYIYLPVYSHTLFCRYFNEFNVYDGVTWSSSSMNNYTHTMHVQYRHTILT